MSQIMRGWLAFAGFGAGLVHLALVVGSPLPTAIVLVGLGIAESAWGVLILVRGRLVAPNLARYVALTPVIGWSLLVVAATLLDQPAIAAALTFIPMAIATVFDLFAAIVLSVHLRRGEPEASAPGTEPSAGRYLLALISGAVLLGALTTPALAATEAGRYAQPHGEHTADFVPTPDGGESTTGLVPPDHEAH